MKVNLYMNHLRPSVIVLLLCFKCEFSFLEVMKTRGLILLCSQTKETYRIEQWYPNLYVWICRHADLILTNLVKTWRTLRYISIIFQSGKQKLSITLSSDDKCWLWFQWNFIKTNKQTNKQTKTAAYIEV